MNKISYDQELMLKQKSLEHQLWEVVWSYSCELGLDNDDVKKEKIALAKYFIQDFASSVAALDLYFDYPVVHIFLTSFHMQQNFLNSDEVQNIMKLNGPDNNAKLALLVKGLKDKGIIWSR